MRQVMTATKPFPTSLLITMLLAASIIRRRTLGFSHRLQIRPKSTLLTTASSTFAGHHHSVTKLDALDSRKLRFYNGKSNDSIFDFGNTNNLLTPNATASNILEGLLGMSFIPASLTNAAEPILSQTTARSGQENSENEQRSSPRLNSSSNPLSSIPEDLLRGAKRGYGPYITLSPEEHELFSLLRKARKETELSTTLRVAGGWVRDKLLATPEFARPSSGTAGRLTSKYKQGSMGRKGTKVLSNTGGANADDDYQNQPVDIDIALDDMLGRAFADHLNEYLAQVGEETHSVGVVLKNPEKSKHLETATMKVGSFWIDFVNLRAEEYTQDSRIPDLMRIGTAAEDAFRRDLTINALFYNINNGQVEDWTGRGFDDLRRGIVATPLAPLTTLLDDPLRALRSVRFAARLRFTMDDALIEAAMDERVRRALAEKVSRERIGGEVDLMLRSPDPVGAMRLLINLNLAQTVFPMECCFINMDKDEIKRGLLEKGLTLLSETYDHLDDCRLSPPTWCQKTGSGSYATFGIKEMTLREDEEARRLLWYAAFLKPLHDHASEVSERHKSRRQGKKARMSTVCRLLVDELKRPTREGEAVERIMKGANDFTRLMDSGCDVSALSILLSDIRVEDDKESADNAKLKCSMGGKTIYSVSEDDPVWRHAMEFRRICAKLVNRVGPLWRAALFLSLSERIAETLEGDLNYVIEGDIVEESQEELRLGEIQRYDAFATAMQRIGVVGIWEQKPLMDGKQIKKVLPAIPKGPAFRDVMEEQEKWMVLHPGAGEEFLVKHLEKTFPDFVVSKN